MSTAGPGSELQTHSVLRGTDVLKPDIVEKIEQALAHDGAAKHRIIWPGDADAGNFQDLVRERPLLIVQTAPS